MYMLQMSWTSKLLYERRGDGHLSLQVMLIAKPWIHFAAPSPFPTWFHTLSIRSICRSPVWRSCSISLLIYTLSMRKISRSPLGSCWSSSLLNPFTFNKTIGRTPLWSSWSISLLIPCTLHKEYKQKCSGELRVRYLTDFNPFQYRI